MRRVEPDPASLAQQFTLVTHLPDDEAALREGRMLEGVIPGTFRVVEIVSDGRCVWRASEEKQPHAALMMGQALPETANGA